MHLCQELGFSNIFFEGDCLQVIKAANDTQHATISLSLIVFDIQHFLTVRLDWKVVYVNKEANRCAHLLAKIACNYVNESIWIEDFLEDITFDILVDKLCNSLTHE